MPPGDKLHKIPTGIRGFDQISAGGVPCNRTSLLMGGSGTGKTVFALQTLVNAARQRGEAGIFISFEENIRNLVTNAESFGWNLPALIGQNKLFFLDAQISADVVQCGKFDLAGLLASIGAKAAEIQAKMVIFDSIDVLLSLLNDPVAEHQECYRLRDWLAASGLTAIITFRISGETPSPIQPQPLAQYRRLDFLSDCVILLNQRVLERNGLRELRVLKYRGSGFDEHVAPMSISSSGILVNSFIEIDSRGPGVCSGERISSGVGALDNALDGGFMRGCSILITGAPGTGKSSMAGAFADAACRRGEQTLYFSVDQEGGALVRDLASVNILLKPHLESGLLQMQPASKSARGLEEELIRIKDLIERTNARCVVVDSLSVQFSSRDSTTAREVAEQLIHYGWQNCVTVFFTSLAYGSHLGGQEALAYLTTLVDNWLHLDNKLKDEEFCRNLAILKARGTRHSNRLCELSLSGDGIRLVPAAKSAPPGGGQSG